MDIHDKLLKEIERATDSRSFRPAIMAQKFAEMDYNSQIQFVGVIAETLYYIQRYDGLTGSGIPPTVTKFTNALLGRFMGHLYNTGEW